MAAPRRPVEPDARSQPRESARRCIASGEVRPKTELLRFVVAPDGWIVLDAAGGLPGRGLWLSARRDMVERACARNLFARAARAEVRVPEALPEQIEQALRRRCLDLIGLARRAGQAVAGYQKVRGWLSLGKAAVLVEALDGAADGRNKVVALARGVKPDLPIVGLFQAAELGRSLGRDAVVHVALAAGGVTDRFLAESRRLTGMATFVAGTPAISPAISPADLRNVSA